MLVELVGCEDDEARSPTNFSSWVVQTLEMLRKAFTEAITDKELLQQINKESIYLDIEVNAKFVALEDLKEILEN